jgi:glycosyltransferase involved in cell wall biosynthesis
MAADHGPVASARPVRSQEASPIRTTGDVGTVTVLHDYFTQRGGAERIAVLLAQSHGGGGVRTSAVSYEDTFPEVAALTLRTLLPRMPRVLLRHRPTLGLLAGLAFLARRIDTGAVLCSSSGWSHWIRGRAPRIVYCHTPARWLYEPDDYFRSLSRKARTIVSVVLAPLRVVDRRRMRTASVVIANGPVTADRIRRAYGIEPETILPPPGLSSDGPREPLPGVESDFFLTVARPRGYKNLELIKSVLADRLDEQLVVVGGTGRDSSGGRVLEVGSVSDAQLRWLYEHARAVICLAHEDLGLVPLEAFQFGTPAVALGEGGYLATCRPDVNAVLVESEDAAALDKALDTLVRASFSREKIVASAAEFGTERFAREISSVIMRASGASRMRSNTPAETGTASDD